LSAKDQHRLDTRKLKDYEATLLISKTHSFEVKPEMGFLHAFTAFESKESRGKNCQELIDQRYGHWIFLYAVIQSLPMLVIDAPGVKFSEGVEYFLCQPPMGGLPWLSDAGGPRKEWYGVGESGTVVSLPSDVVNYGMEATYNRSHCWQIANKWISGSEAGTMQTAPTPEPGQGEPLSPLAPPPGFAGGELGLRPGGRTMQRSADTTPSLGTPTSTQEERSRSRQAKRRSIAVGLNRLPIPAGIAAQENFSPSFSPSFTPVSGGSRGTSPGGYGSAGGERRMSSNPGSTFDDILKNMDKDPAPTKKKK
jgi:hypothetical protein